MLYHIRTDYLSTTSDVPGINLRAFADMNGTGDLFLNVDSAHDFSGRPGGLKPRRSVWFSWRLSAWVELR